jgi:DnaJ-class molecular chaperone
MMQKVDRILMQVLVLVVCQEDLILHLGVCQVEDSHSTMDSTRVMVVVDSASVTPNQYFPNSYEDKRVWGGGGGFEDMFEQMPRSRASGGGRSRAQQFGASDARQRAATPEVTTVERPLPLTLEELFKGAHKKMKIKRKAYDEVTGKRTTQDKVLEMDIKPGLKKGSKIKFKGVGDQEEGGQQDLHFIIEEASLSFPMSQT